MWVVFIFVFWIFLPNVRMVLKIGWCLKLEEYSMQLQLLKWLHLSPVTNWPYDNPLIFKDWWSSFLFAAKLDSFTFEKCLDEHFDLTQIKVGSTLILTILSINAYR